MLFLDYNHYLLTRAESIDGILHMVESENLRSASPHVVLFADAEKAVSIEVDGTRSAVRPMAKDYGIHVQTNHFMNPLLKERELEFPLEREHTVDDALQDNYGKLDVRRMIDIISCNMNTCCMATNLVGDFPAQLNTLTSAVFEPETGNFWIASGRPPAVCYNRYEGFNFYRELEGKPRKLPAYSRSHTPVLKGSSFMAVTDCMRRSMWLFLYSQEKLKKGKIHQAIRSVEKAIELHPDPGYEYVRAILYLIKGDALKALEFIRYVKASHTFSPVKQSALDLWEGRSLDILGRRKEAKACYHGIIRTSGIVKNLKRAAKRRLRYRFTHEQMPKIVDYLLLGPLEFV